MFLKKLMLSSVFFLNMYCFPFPLQVTVNDVLLSCFSAAMARYSHSHKKAGDKVEDDMLCAVPINLRRGSEPVLMSEWDTFSSYILLNDVASFR